MPVIFSEDEFARLMDILHVYELGHEMVFKKLKSLRQDLMNFHDSNPIEHIKGRIKSPENIALKLHRMGFELTVDNAKQHLTDISGIRIICPFAKDIYSIVDILADIPEWRVIIQKDYISNPKPSGYRSFHLIIEIPVCYEDKTEKIPVEFQIRTAAMDFWATMEHKAKYKYNNHIPQHLSDEFIICANKIAELDERMFLIHEILTLINQDSV